MADNYGDILGVSDIYAALVTKDDTTGYVASSQVDFLAPVADVSQETAVNTTPRYYSNKPRYVSSTEGETTVSMTVSGVPLDLAAKYLGKGYDPVTGRMVDTGKANAPWAAITFAADVEGDRLGGNGGARKYYSFLKGKFAPYSEEAATKTDDIDARTTSLAFTAVATIYEKFIIPQPEGGSLVGSVKRVVGDNRVSATETDSLWFGAIQTPVDGAGTADASFKVGLKNMLAVAGNLTQATYTADSWAKVNAAKTAGATVNSNASATKVQAVEAQNALRVAINELVAA